MAGAELDLVESRLFHSQKNLAIVGIVAREADLENIG